jgi:hypothetical protein
MTAPAPLPEPTFVIHADQPGYSGAQPFVPLSDFRKLRARLQEAERELEAVRGLLTDIRTFIYTVNNALMLLDGDNAQATTLLDQIDQAIEKRAALSKESK